MAENKTVKVRIPVVIDGKGQWHAEAWSEASDAQNRDGLFDYLGFEPKGECRVYFIEADVSPPPKSATIKGKVTAPKGRK